MLAGIKRRKEDGDMPHGLKEYEPERLERYYKRVIEYLEMSSFWRNLQYKAEAGTTRSEKGYQMIAKSMVERTARALGYDEGKATALSMCVGCAFPVYGKEGMREIIHYIKRNSIDLDPDLILIGCIEDYIGVRLFVATDLDAVLREYYLTASLEQITTPEVLLVRVCQDAISKVKLVERFSKVNGGELLYSVSQEIEELSKQAGKPMPSASLDQMIRSLEIVEEDRMTAGECEAVAEAIRGFIQAFGKEGVYKYIPIDSL